ncbi:MAG: AAA family ATPase [Planktothrix sp.]
MLHRLYVNNFRCLENFEFTTKGISSALLIGKNGSGKSTIATALEVLQSIGRGINKVNQLLQTQDFSQGRSNIPIRIEIEVFLPGKTL